MAVVLGYKLVKDNVLYNDYALGLSLPLQMTNTAFNQTFQTVDQVKTNIISLLSTNKGERLMQPELGSGLKELLFEQNDGDLETKIEEDITGILAKWLPFVSVYSIDINKDDTNYYRDINRVNVSIKFSIGQTPDLNVVTFTVTQ